MLNQKFAKKFRSRFEVITLNKSQSFKSKRFNIVVIYSVIFQMFLSTKIVILLLHLHVIPISILYRYKNLTVLI